MQGMRRRWMAPFMAAALTIAAVAAGCNNNNDGPSPVTTSASKVQHVFTIILENRNFADTFQTSTQDPYLQKTLVPQGALLTQYYGTGHVSLDNYISMVSGQAPTPDTDDDCIPGFVSANGNGNFNDVAMSGTAAYDQVVASGGCVYPSSVKTISDQLVAAGKTWKGYMGDMGNDPARESATCGHPTLGTGTDATNSAEAPSASVPLGDAYATRHDPFVYFHSIIDDTASCAAHVVNLNQLTTDLASVATTPNYVFITPNLCDDAHDGDGTGAKPCANGQPGGLTSADAFLQKWVPAIMASPAFKQDGLLIITFDESGAASQTTTTSTNPDGSTKTTINVTESGNICCNQQPGPNLGGVRPGTVTVVNTATLVENLVFSNYGGDQIGALLLSPFVKAGSTSSTPYNHYSMLRSLEDIYQIPTHLGYADDSSLSTIGDDSAIFNPATN